MEILKYKYNIGKNIGFQENLVVWKFRIDFFVQKKFFQFQENLVVWKFDDFRYIIVLFNVSGELSSMEITLLFIRKILYLFVSGELSSMEIVVCTENV